MHHTHCIFATELLSVDISRIFVFAYGYCHIAAKQARPFITNCLCIILIAFLQLSYCQSTFSTFFCVRVLPRTAAKQARPFITNCLCIILVAFLQLGYCRSTFYAFLRTGSPSTLPNLQLDYCNKTFACSFSLLLLHFNCRICNLGHFHSANFGVIPHLGLDRVVLIFSLGFAQCVFFSFFFLSGFILCLFSLVD